MSAVSPKTVVVLFDISGSMEKNDTLVNAREATIKLLRGAVRLSDHPRARVVRIDTSKASAMPGVVAVVTAADVPGQNYQGDIRPDWPQFTGEGEISSEQLVVLMWVVVRLVVRERMRRRVRRRMRRVRRMRFGIGWRPELGAAILANLDRIDGQLAAAENVIFLANLNYREEIGRQVRDLGLEPTFTSI